MSARTGEWHLVGRDSDPVPASQGDVEVISREMASRAAAAQDIKDVLSKLADLDGWKGDAAEVFAKKAGEATDNLGKVVDRYEAVAEALTSWARDVGDARTDTWTALQKAEAAQETVDSNAETKPVDGADLTAGELAANTRRSDAQDDLDAARTALDHAMDALDSAAERAKDRIEDAADKWDDGMFAGLKNWIREHADVIDLLVTILEIVAIVLAVVLLIVVVFFSAPFLLIAAAVGVAALILIGTIMLAAADTGKRDWKDVGMAALGLVLTVAGGGLAKLAARGLARLVPQVATRVGTSAGNATKAAWSQRLASWPAFQSASRITNPANNLARWATGVRGNMATAVQAADDAGRAGVQALESLPATRLSRLLMQDDSLAQSATTLRALRNLGLQGTELPQATRIVTQIRTGVVANLGNLGVTLDGVPDTIDRTIYYAQHDPWTTRP